MDDASLVGAAAGGDREAFAAIYDRYASRLYDFLYSVLRDREEAADVLQDTFLTAGSRLHQLRDPTKLRPWLYAIARHRALRVAERRSRFEPLGPTEVTATNASPEESVGREELAALVWSAAEGLSPRDRVVLDLHLRQGLEGQELGDALGVSADHAYVLLSRLRDQVERSLGALLVVRQGRRECSDLEKILDGWDGRYSPLWRKRVARHVDGCELCGDTRRRLASPVALLSATPAFALPAGLRTRVLDDVELASHKGRPWRAAGGFPPPMVTVRRRRTFVSAVAAAVVLLVGGAVAADRTDDTTVTPLAVSGTATTVAGTSPVAISPVITSPATVPEAGELPAAGAVPKAINGGGAVAGAPITTLPTRVTIIPETTTTRPRDPATTIPPDTEPPALGRLTVDPATVRPPGRCSNTTDPEQASVSVEITDASGVESVVLEPGRTAMRRLTGGNTYRGVVGPLAPSEPGTQERVVVTVTATDGAGNRQSISGFLVAKCDPAPQ